MQKNQKDILWFSDLRLKDLKYVGGKNSSLGEMFNTLTKQGVIVPDGFCTTAKAFQDFLEYNDLIPAINKLLKEIGNDKEQQLKVNGKKIRSLVLQGRFPENFENDIVKAYNNLSKKYKSRNVDVAVRSSATAEDLPTASFAGQQESYLNIKGGKQLLGAIKLCYASLYTNRAISYRLDQGFGHEKVYLSVGIQKMVRSDLASSGVMFTLDTESGFKDIVLINSSYGLGEYIVKGHVSPDEFFVFKQTNKIIKKTLGPKKNKLVYAKSLKRPTKNKKVKKKDQNKFSLTDKEILKLAKWGMEIEKHYKRPMDIEWAKDGLEDKLYIVQARPETVESAKKATMLEQYILSKRGKILTEGESIGQKIATGKVRVIKNVKNLDKLKSGEVLVTKMTDPDWEPVMKRASAIVTDSGGRTCHAAIVSRELGVPAVVGTRNATAVLKDGQAVTVSCAESENGYIYQGELDFKIKRSNLKKIKKPKKPEIKMNLGDPTQAMINSFIPNDGVGLARIEFIITSYIKIHPNALIDYHKLDKKTKKKINKITAAYKDKKQFYVDQLAYGVSMIAAAFYPKEVIVRFSDFKTNEYNNLIGGQLYEPVESNPMIGWRGASRYYDPKYKSAFVLECKAIKKVRDEMGLTNVKVMVPFCRTVDEGKKVINIINQNGLKQGKNGLEIYVMTEIPSNVILLDKFAEIFDGFSIGSNDLTQLCLGLDRDSELIANISDERNLAVKRLISQAIKTAKKYKKKIGICGQAPSDFPEFASFLAKEGIDSMSLTPDSVLKTIKYLKTKK